MNIATSIMTIRGTLTSLTNAPTKIANLPIPNIKFGKAAAGGGVKNYGGAVTPLRWLKSGDLELSSDVMMLSNVDGRSYTGVVVFTVGFDRQHHASVRKVGTTETVVDPSP